MSNSELERAANSLGYQLIDELNGKLSLHDDEYVENSGVVDAGSMRSWLENHAHKMATHHQNSLRYHTLELDKARRAQAILGTLKP